MRVAIVGGGASGVATAYLLDGAHDVVLYEREPVLGGHVRTLGANVACDSLPPGVTLDAGVVEFDRGYFPKFQALLRDIGVETIDLPDVGSTTLSLRDGRHFHSPEALRDEHSGVARVRAILEDLPIGVRHRRFLARPFMEGGVLDAEPLGTYLGTDTFSTWLRALVMYAYSTAYESVDELSAGLALPMLRDFLSAPRWTCIPGGAYAWIARVAARLRGTIRLNASIERIDRYPDRVELRHAAGDIERFDAVVLAVPPHRVLRLLGAPFERERAWFEKFEGGPVETVVHHDGSPYLRRGIRRRSEFDLFGLESGDFGYNAYLNRLAGLPVDHGPQYGLAFHLDDELEPSRVIHRQRHDVARYTAEALATRNAIAASNGTDRTFFVGAYLGDGLHEGAVRSALEVSNKLAGLRLR